MSLKSKHDNRVARAKIARNQMKNYMEERASAERIPLQNQERTCQKYGFKAHYPFVRCPECNEVQK